MKLNAVIFAAVVAGSASAQMTTTAIGNATIKPSGVRTGASGTNFFNVESNANTTNADFGAVDYNFGTQANYHAATVSVSFTEANAAFTTPGLLDFYLTTDTADSIVAGTSTLVYNAGGANNGIDTHFYAPSATLYSLGSGMFNTTGNVNNGSVDTYTFNVSGAVASYINSQLAGGSNLRLVVAADEAAAGTTKVAATWAGYTNSTTTSQPTLTITPVATPEPSSLALMGLGFAGLAARRRRK